MHVLFNPVFNLKAMSSLWKLLYWVAAPFQCFHNFGFLFRFIVIGEKAIST